MLARLTRSLASFVVLMGLLVLGLPAAAQQSIPFTAEDMLKVVSVSVLDLTDDGRRVAVSARRSIDAVPVDNARYGDPTYSTPARVRLTIVDTTSLASVEPFKGLVDLRQAAWAHDGKRLAIVLGEAAEPARPATTAGKPKARARGASAPAPASGPFIYLYDAEKDLVTEVPRKPAALIASSTSLDWTAEDTKLIVALRSPEWEKTAAARFKALTEGPVIVHTSKEPFLEWDGMQRTGRTRLIGEIDLATGDVTTILPEQRLNSYTVSRDTAFVTFGEDTTEKTSYDDIGGSETRLKIVERSGGTTRTILEPADMKGIQLRWSDDGRMFAYARKGEVFVQRIDEAKPRSLTPPPPGEKKEAQAAKPAGDAAAEKKEEERESFSVVMFSRDASTLLVTSRKGWYTIKVADATRQQILTLDEDEEKNPRISAVAWSPDGSELYLSYGERDRWMRGFEKLTIATRARTTLVKDTKVYSGLRPSRDGRTFVLNISDGDHPGDLYVANADFSSVRRLTDANAWMNDRAVPRSELVSYRDADGKLLRGVLRYPVNYVKGQKYPTVFELYETFFDNGFNARAAFLANHGYAVFHPSVNLVIGRPGEAWVKGVTSAANALIEMGVTDPDRLGVHGTSYGGYATVLLITQTDRFKAAVNVSGKVNMVSFYTDSPRLGVRNTHAPEKSQDRIGGTLWEYPERYLEHSAVLRADRIKTPLLCITGDLDPNVPASQSREIYYALRRLGKEVEWVRYARGAHRPPSTSEESVDFELRILAWYDKFLKAPSKKTD